MPSPTACTSARSSSLTSCTWALTACRRACPLEALAEQLLELVLARAHRLAHLDQALAQLDGRGPAKLLPAVGEGEGGGGAAGEQQRGAQRRARALLPQHRLEGAHRGGQGRSCSIVRL